MIWRKANCAMAPKRTDSRNSWPWNWPNSPTGAMHRIKGFASSSTMRPPIYPCPWIRRPINSGAWPFPCPTAVPSKPMRAQQSIDPFLVAALIRQESEFNPKAISRSNARGLTQVLPGTGRELSRKLKIPRFRTAMLFTPDTNVKIGTYYLKALLDQLPRPLGSHARFLQCGQITRHWLAHGAGPIAIQPSSSRAFRSAKRESTSKAFCETPKSTAVSTASSNVYTLITGQGDCRIIEYTLVRSRPSVRVAWPRPITTRSAP